MCYVIRITCYVLRVTHHSTHFIAEIVQHTASGYRNLKQAYIDKLVRRRTIRCMTISAVGSLPATKVLDKLLADAGVAGAHGFEVLRLVRAVDHIYDRLLYEVTRDGPVTVPRWRILLRLWIEEQLGQGAVNPTHLSRTQQVAKNTISDHLRALEESGLIERELDQEDRRQFKIHLTEAGRAIVQEYTPVHARYLNQPLACFAPQEIAQLQQLLSKLHTALLAEIGGCPCAVEPEQEQSIHTLE